MLVRPKFKSIEDAGLDESDVRRQLKMHGGDPLKELTGDYYIVFSVKLGNIIEYGLDLEPEGSLPLFYHSDLFEIIDDRISRYWVFSPKLLDTASHNARSAMLTISAWAHNRMFFDQLVNSDETTWNTWRKYKSMMEMEFATPNIKRKAENVGEGWVLCAECANAWKADSDNHEIVKCPSCGTLQVVDRSALYRFKGKR